MFPLEQRHANSVQTSIWQFIVHDGFSELDTQTQTFWQFSVCSQRKTVGSMDSLSFLIHPLVFLPVFTQMTLNSTFRWTNLTEAQNVLTPVSHAQRYISPLLTSVLCYCCTHSFLYFFAGLAGCPIVLCNMCTAAVTQRLFCYSSVHVSSCCQSASSCERSELDVVELCLYFHHHLSFTCLHSVIFTAHLWFNISVFFTHYNWL